MENSNLFFGKNSNILENFGEKVGKNSNFEKNSNF